MPTFDEIKDQVSHVFQRFRFEIQGIIIWVVIPENLSFECERCGACCRQQAPPLLESDLNRLDGVVDLATVCEETQGSVTGLRLKQNEFGNCCFYETDGTRATCKQYAKRPMFCRRVPLDVYQTRTQNNDSRLPDVLFLTYATERNKECRGYRIGRPSREQLHPAVNAVRKRWVEIGGWWIQARLEAGFL